MVVVWRWFRSLCMSKSLSLEIGCTIPCQITGVLTMTIVKLLAPELQILQTVESQGVVHLSNFLKIRDEPFTTFRKFTVTPSWTFWPSPEQRILSCFTVQFGGSNASNGPTVGVQKKTHIPNNDSLQSQRNWVVYLAFFVDQLQIVQVSCGRALLHSALHGLKLPLLAQILILSASYLQFFGRKNSRENTTKKYSDSFKRI